MSDIINDTKSKMQKSVDNLSRELANISAGRANSNLLNGVTVDYYVRLRLYNNLQASVCQKHVY